MYDCVFIDTVVAVNWQERSGNFNSFQLHQDIWSGSSMEESGAEISKKTDETDLSDAASNDITPCYHTPPKIRRVDSELEQNVAKIEEHVDEISVPPLQDDQMRWLVIGICLHSIISPALRKYIPKTMQGLYTSLKQHDNIDKQIYGKHLERCGPAYLNYNAINCNFLIPRNFRPPERKYNYNVRDAVELSKLFLPTCMTQYTGFDDTCDASALLGIVINVDIFPAHLRTAAEEIRDDVRNPWAHCNFSTWDISKFQKCFDSMKKMLKYLCLPVQDEALLLQQLQTWQANALHVLHGTLGFDFLQTLSTETSLLARYCRSANAISDNNFEHIREALKQVDCILRLLKEKLHELETENKDIKREQSTFKDTINTVTAELETTKQKIDKLTSTNQASSREVRLFSPPRRIKHFVGHETELQLLKHKFNENGRSTCTLAICGLGGIGKTSLASEFCYHYREQYPGGIYWTVAEDEDSLLDSFMRLSARIGVGNDRPKDTMRHTLNWLSSKSQRWLLVIDNLDSEALGSTMLELLFGDWKHDICGNILITTRRERISAKEVLGVDSCISLQQLSEMESVRFMKERTCSDDSECDDKIKALVSELHGLPLALEQAAAHIKVLKCSFQEYLDGYKANRFKMLKSMEKHAQYNTSAERQAVQTTWNMNFKHIADSSKEAGVNAVTAMEQFALLPHLEIIPEIHGHLLSFDKLMRKQEIEILARFSIVSRDQTETLLMHRLVKQAIEENMSVDRKLRLLSLMNISTLATLGERVTTPILPETVEEQNIMIANEKRELAYLNGKLVKNYELKKKYELLLNEGLNINN
ncbi:uncharacterized protein LOC128547028 [Mercenaria mercenaria]|uniref:uncharacterized protein LOC128547028 n=1 Tax=Mercenaria mercenaria TaxID=6596 RepID=UPI00234F6F47|nr:uncharacterized protein LOC128547028 [Mercenaria mercenaria]